MKRKETLVAVSLGLVQLAFVHAEAFAQRQDTTNLNEVVVTASRTPRKISEIGKVVNVITKEEIERAQGRTIPELLNTISGLTIAGSGSHLGNVQSVYLRGASAANTLILIDGIPVNDASAISGEFNISAIDVSQIERIEILKGASSTIYGSDAVAGVINVITKKGYGKPLVNALMSGGSYRTFKGAAGISGSAQKTNYSFTISNLSSNGFSAASSNSNQQFDKDGFQQRNIGLNLSRAITNNFSIKLGLQGNQNKADLDDGAFTDRRDYIYDKSSLFAFVAAKLGLTKGDLQLNISQNNVENTFDKQTSQTFNKGNITNLDGIFNYELTDFLAIVSGANFRYTATDQKYIDPQYPSSLDTSNHISSIYSSAFLKAGEIFKMELGGRYNSHSQYGENFTYTINPSLHFQDNLKLYLNISSAYRVPSLYQLYSDYGNINLKPELSDTYETGLQGSFLDKKVSFTASLFKRNLRDVIEFGQINPTTYGYINQSRQNDRGFELQLDLKPTKTLSINTFFNYVNGKIKLDENSPELFNLIRRPKSSVGCNLGYQFNQKFYASLNYKWNDQRLDQYYDPSTFSSISVNLPNYHRTDLYVQYQFKNVNLFADVKNIFDADYNDFAGYTAMGTNFNAGLSIRIN